MASKFLISFAVGVFVSMAGFSVVLTWVQRKKRLEGELRKKYSKLS